MGQYTDIVEIVAPGSAVGGSTVNVEVRIKNLYGYAINATATMGRVDGTVLRFGAVHKVIGAGQIVSWYDSFVMPAKVVTVSVESWYEGTDNIWHSDDRAEKQISLGQAISEFGSIEILRYERR
ncbi:hypothetical protein ACFLVC_02015 [Chloroflexota bacterium]